MGDYQSRLRLWAKREKLGLCVYCGKCPPSQSVKHCSTCLAKKHKTNNDYVAKNKDKIKAYWVSIKKEVIEKYGGRCACCFESELCFLSIDHTNNDGAQDRIAIYGMKNPSSRSWYLKLRREERRNDLQVLCFNCNLGKQINGGVCPHQTKLIV